MKKIKNSISKKNVDIEAECIGIPIGKRKEKEKKPDLTFYINEFLSNPITLKDIGEILCKVEGYGKRCDKIKVFQLCWIKYNPHAYLIMIKPERYFEITFYITNRNMIYLNDYKPIIVLTSDLKRKMFDKIYKYLLENKEKITLLSK